MIYGPHLLVYLGMFGILTLSLNLLVGYCGIFSLAHAAYFAVGGYTYAFATSILDLSFFPAAALAMVLGAVASLAISLPAWRFRGDFLVLITLAVHVFITSTLHNWRSVTSGPQGLTGVARPEIVGITLDTDGSRAVLALGLLAGCAFILWLLKISPWGRLLKSIRDDELAARNLGKNVRAAKVWVAAISCAFAALAGVIYASHSTYLEPGVASLEQSILLLSMLIVGGTGNLRGPLLGAAVLVALPELLRPVFQEVPRRLGFEALPASIVGHAPLLAYGLLLVLIIHFRPQGLAGEYNPK